MFCIQLNKRLDHWVLKPYRLVNMNLHPYLGLETPFKDQEFQLVTLSPPHPTADWVHTCGVNRAGPPFVNTAPLRLSSPALPSLHGLQAAL